MKITRPSNTPNLLWNDITYQFKGGLCFMRVVYCFWREILSDWNRSSVSRGHQSKGFITEASLDTCGVFLQPTIQTEQFHSELNELSWVEEAMIARMHPVISILKLYVALSQSSMVLLMIHRYEYDNTRGRHTWHGRHGLKKPQHRDTQSEATSPS